MIEKSAEESIILGILHLADLLRKNGDNISQRLGITTQQWLIMLHLANDPNLPYLEKNKHQKPLMASELAESLSVTRPNVTKILRTLLQKGLVAQTEDEIDRRRKRLELTDEGWEIINLLEPLRRAYNRQLLADFSDVEKTRFLDFIRSSADWIETDNRKNLQTVEEEDVNEELA
ncbi:MAG TPA: MarR family transcriptional regulator [Saprospiraceae bacterium]|nr:MarR family transcriptional regulator [Saprospiraceae bacterium]HMP25728.1 MarR family transcriptional regulator [Saprospiraceae bacterium]